jgi:hypothetical protein
MSEKTTFLVVYEQSQICCLQLYMFSFHIPSIYYNEFSLKSFSCQVFVSYTQLLSILLGCTKFQSTSVHALLLYWQYLMRSVWHLFTFCIFTALMSPKWKMWNLGQEERIISKNHKQIFCCTVYLSDSVTLFVIISGRHPLWIQNYASTSFSHILKKPIKDASIWWVLYMPVELFVNKIFHT